MRADRFMTDEQKKAPLTDDEVARLWPEFNEAHSESQRTFDTSVRTLAAAGIAVSATLAGAFGALGWSGDIAVCAFVTSLLLNLSSYGSAQIDMIRRLEAVVRRDRPGTFGSRWTPVTTALNTGSGIALFVGRRVPRGLRDVDVNHLDTLREEVNFMADDKKERIVNTEAATLIRGRTVLPSVAPPPIEAIHHELPETAGLTPMGSVPPPSIPPAETKPSDGK